jgi:hypothetical protein
MFRSETLPEGEIFEILANRRRRETIRHLSVDADGRARSLKRLSEEIATRETGQSPPPRAVRESVYNSLHQTHLPKLEELGVVTYDREAREVRLRERARDVNVYMEVITDYGVTWSEVYRTLGVVALTVVVAALAEIPWVGAVDPLLWATGFLILFVVATSYQLWSNRWYLVRLLRK